MRIMLESRASGILFLGIFGGLWLFLAASGLHPPYPVLADVLALAMAGVLFMVSMGFRKAARLQPEASAAEIANRARADKWLYWSMGVEGVVLFLTANVLINLHLTAYLWPAVALIVGLHFYPLAYGLRLRVYNFTATLMCLSAVAAMAGIKSGDTLAMGWDSAVCIASAALLWGTCGYIWLKVRKALTKPVV